jgi:hypothetical protein
MRFDADHINAEAAEEFTRLVAHRFSQLIEEKRIP